MTLLGAQKFYHLALLHFKSNKRGASIIHIWTSNNSSSAIAAFHIKRINASRQMESQNINQD